jgi:hypothetical protein
MCNLKTIFVLIITSAFISCNDFDSPSSENIFIDTDSIEERYDISSIIENVTLLPLKEKSGSFIGEPYKVFRVGQNTIVFDKIKSKRIVVFDKNGNYLAKPAEVGRSLEDPLQLNDCWIDLNEELQVYDFSAKKIYKYDKQFNLKEAFQSDYDRIFNALLDDKNNKYIGYKGYSPYNSYIEKENYKIALLDNNLAMIKKFMPYNQKLNDALVPNTNLPLQRIDNSINIIQSFSNSIYRLKDEKLIEKYKLTYSKASLADFEKNILIPKHLILTSQKPDLKMISSLFNGYYTFKGDWKETNNYIILQSFDPTGKVFYSIYDKLKKKVLINAYELTFDDKKSLVPSFMTTSFKTNEFIAVYPGYMLKPVISKDSKYISNIIDNLEINYVLNIKFK